MISEFFNENTRNVLASAFFDLENKDEATTHTVIAKLPSAIQKMVSTFSTSEELLSKNWQRAIQRFFLNCYDFFSDALKEKVENEYIKISKCKADADRKWVKKQLYCINKFSLFYKSLESLLNAESKNLIDELSKWAENDEEKKKVKSTVVDFISSNTLHELNFNDITVDSLPDIFHFDIIRLKMQSFIWKKKEDQKRGLLELPNSFYHLCKLNTLCLIGHKFTAVPKEIEKLTEIKHLDLSCNNIATIAPFIKKLKKLEVLNISSNPIIQLPNEVLDLPRNCVINLSNTKVSKQIQDTIKSHLRNDLVIVFEQNQNIDKNQLIELSISVLFGNENSQKNHSLNL
ncbi:MAG: leucine-rich repeat domain-containing protein [Chlamydiae bacterium]|nr:leucine-rich repeat domain-containing protein [Chlamydiota bacterium]